jgi:molecular chaperone GrpE
MQQPARGIEAGHIVQVLQQGFLLHERVLRPAAVIVAG